MKLCSLLLVFLGAFVAACGEPDDLSPPEDTVDDPGSIDQPLGSTLFSDSFSQSRAIVTNEYAYYNPTHGDAVISPSWQITSGSLYLSSGTAWSGKADDIKPDALSTNGNDSAVFRMTTKRTDFGNVAVTFSLRNNALVTTARTPSQTYDGVHIFLRHQSETSMYYVSVNRRDGIVVVKKKVPGGTSNGGTYYTLSSNIPYQVPYGSWQTIKATVANLSTGGVRIKLTIGGVLLASVLDDGHIGGPPITKAGRVGIRGDNCNFQLDNFSVASL
jgi:hypothetical protein